jgi:tRNA pseudouridine55 synthase
VTATSAARPTRAAIEAALPRFVGAIAQAPPAYSAIKRDGRPAYARARAGEAVELAPRTVRIDRLALVDLDGPDRAVFEVDCGKGTYVRSLARDLAQALGTLGFVDELRRLAVGRFRVEEAISLDMLASPGYTPAAHLRPLETALDDIPALAVDGAQAESLRRGRTVQVPRAASVPLAPTAIAGRPVAVLADGRLVALARIEDGILRPLRVINPGTKETTPDVDQR